MKTRRWSNPWIRGLALLMSLLMCVALLPLKAAKAEEADREEASASEPASEQPIVIRTEDGEIAADEDWNTVYPFGTFAFGNHQADIAEPGAVTADSKEIPQSVLIPVYRLGGTTGKAIVRILYSPAITTETDGTGEVYDYAASGKTDVQIEIEDPSAIAAYQPLALPEAERRMTASDAAILLPDPTDETKAEDELVLSLSESADAYRWQVLEGDFWVDIAGANDATLSVGWGDLWDFDEGTWVGRDFRCLMTRDGAMTCSVTLLGETFTPYPEPEVLPENLDFAEPGFTTVQFDEEYDLYTFDLTFADGETVKYIRVTALDDAEAELPEFGLFTITGAVGGALSDTGNTLTLMISDNDAGEPSTLGFKDEAVTADRADGAAKVTIVREGGKSYNLTVHYETEDGTAVAGVDYAAISGELAFAGSIDEIVLPIELIRNNDTSEKTFTVVLTMLRGGGQNELSKLVRSRVTVTIRGESQEPGDDGAGQNLASLLNGASGSDVSDKVALGDEPMISANDEPGVLGNSEMGDIRAVAAQFTIPEDTRLHAMPGYYKITRQQLEDYEDDVLDDVAFWRDWDDILGASWHVYDDIDSVHTFSNPMAWWSMDNDSGTSGAWITAEGGYRKWGSGAGNGIMSVSDGNTRGRGGNYYTFKIDTNYRGYVQSSWGDSYAPGDYYDQLSLAFGWARPGVRKTSWIQSDYHRYLRPKITIWVGSWSGNKYFDAYENDEDVTTPGSWDTHMRLRGRGSWEWNQDDCYRHDYTYSDIDGPYLSFGEGFGFRLDFQYFDTWGTSASTTYDKAVTESDITSLFDARAISGHRRQFTTTGQGINLNVYTANDDDSTNGYSQILSGNPIYERVAPTVSIVAEQGGVDSKNNNLYVGTKLMIDTSNLPQNFSLVDNGLYIANSKGVKVGTVTQDTDNRKIWYVTMMWKNMTTDDLNETYTLHMFLNRMQTVEIDISTSTPRDASGAPIASKYETTFKTFLSKTMTGKMSSAVNSNGTLSYNTIDFSWNYDKDRTGFNTNGKGLFYVKSLVANMQEVNFHQDPEDVIVYDGRAYAGNETIKISADDLTQNKLHFTYYNKEYLDAISTMEVFIDHVEIYYDGNGDGLITGTTVQSVFEPTAPDRFIGYATGDYPDSFFKPTRDSAGNVYQYFFKVILKLRPRALQVPAGYSADQKTQLLPAFLSAVTDPSQEMKLTDEQRAYRYVYANNADNHPMFGTEADKKSYIDIPLGGDVGEITLHSSATTIFDSDGEIEDIETVRTFTWAPDYVGNLIVDFDSPSPIVSTSNVTGGAVAIAGENPQIAADGSYVYSSEGLDKLNGNLGAFVGRTTFAIGIQEQVKPMYSTRSQSGITDNDDINPESLTMGDVSSIPSPDDTVNTQSGGSPGETDGTSPDVGSDYKDFKQDLGVELPSMEFGLGENASIIMDGYEIGFSIGIPIYSNEKSKNWGSEKNETLQDGTTKESHRDDDGTLHEKYTKGNTTTNVTTAADPSDPDNPNKRVKTVSTATTDEHGNTTYHNEIRQQELRDGKWVGVHKDTNDNEPQVPSQPDPESNWVNDNTTAGKLKGLKEFCEGCKAGNAKKLLGDAWEDDTYKAAKNGNAASRKFSVSFTVQIAIMFEYNPIDNCHYFKTAGLSATLGFEFTLQMRFAPAPIFYLYAKFGIEIEAGISLTCYRKMVLGDKFKDKDLESGTIDGLKNGGSLVFKLDMREDYKNQRGFVFDLNGKVLMKIYENEDLSDEKPLAAGLLSGDGSDIEVLLQAYDKYVYVELQPAKASEQVTVSTIKPINGAESKVVFDGFTLKPGLSAEFGIGAGIELLKIEGFFKISTELAMTMGGYLEETDQYEGFYISDFEGSMAIGLNVAVGFFNYTLDAIAIGFEGVQHGTRGYFTWTITASAVNGNYTLWETNAYTSADGKTLDGEPQPPNGVNIFTTNKDMHFFRSNGDPVDFSKDAPKNQGWTFRTDVSAWRWSGGEFLGEIPQDADLAEADEKDVFVQFDTEESEIKIYFSGKIKVKTPEMDGSKTYTESPAKVSFPEGSANKTVTITCYAGAKLDRYETVGKKKSLPVNPAGKSLVSISGPKNVENSQKVYAAADDTRAIPATGTDDFQLSGYNTSGDAKKLVGGLATGYDYKLVQAGGQNYIAYPLMQNGVPQLVLSKVVMTGALATTAGLAHPTDDASTDLFLLVDDDGLTDLDFDVYGTDDALVLSWVTYADANGDAFSVKQRSIPLAAGEPLPAIETLYTGTDNLILPATESGDTVWVASSGDGSVDNALLKAYLLATKEGLTEEELDTCATANANNAATVFNWAMQKAINALSGDGSVLKAASGASYSLNGEHVQNLESATVNGKTYLLYTTAQAAYFDPTMETPQTVAREDFDANTDRGVIYRLYLQTLDGSGFSSAKLLKTLVDFDGCSEENIATRRLKDGLYSFDTLAEAHADPYFANLRFATADIDGSGAETVLLFEMNGNTWMMRAEGIASVLNNGAATLTPVFEQTTGTEVEIGSDGTNLAVVYTAPVVNSLSNAIYIAWWDKNMQAWGSPTILAMRDLQIFEDSITYDMTAEDTEKAYLGELHTESGATGSMNKLTFTNLQMTTNTIEVNGNPQTQLMILTNGALTALTKATFNLGSGDFETVVPTGDAAIGFYAIAFGGGEQAIGEGQLGLANYDFTEGDKLTGTLSFRNTGTAAIRGSEANPITAKLMVSTESGDFTVAEWNIFEPIPSGTLTELTFNSLPMPLSLRTNDTYYLYVSEDPTYFADAAYVGMIPDLLKVAEVAELSFNGYDVSLHTVDNGIAYLDFDATVVNNGSADANEVFIQFSYDTGTVDALGNNIYYPVDIRGSELTTSAQKPIRGVVQQNYQNGVYQLQGPDGNDLKTGYYRTVTGSLCVPVECFISTDTLSGLHLKAEIYSDADTPDYRYGVYSSDHKEYNSLNNSFEITIKHRTAFDVPTRINTALGTTLTLPVTFTTTGNAPDLVVTEISDGTPEWQPCMGICYYDAARSVIVAAPNSKAQALIAAGKTPTGVLQIKDVNTNSIAAITYKVSAMADGVNIYRDDASFSFFDPDGTATDLNASAASNPGWMFLDKGVDLGWQGGEPNEIPMNYDLTLANRDNAYFTFETVADSLKFYFMGEIKVEVAGEGISKTETFTSSPATIAYSNDTGKIVSVKVTATAGTRIDRYLPTYAINTVTDTDPDAPQILWNRSFPETASVLDGESVPMRCYIIDGTGVQNVSFNTVQLSETTTPALVKVTDTLWYFEYTFTKNEPQTVRAFDVAGNTSVLTTNVDWFNSVLSAGANADAPELRRNYLSFTDDVGNAFTGTINFIPWLHSSYTPRSDEQSNAYLFYDGAFSETPLEKYSNERWRAISNGCYMVRVDREDGTWAREIAAIDCIDVTIPQLALTAGENAINIAASDDWAIESLTVNGYPIPVSGKVYSGSFPIAFGGDYTVTVTDNAGNTTSDTIHFDVPIRIEGITINVTCANGDILGHMRIASITGGAYDPESSTPARNIYATSYQVKLTSPETTQIPANEWGFDSWSSTMEISGRPGSYALFAKDKAGNTVRYAELIVFAHEDDWSDPTYEWVKSGEQYTVTATSICGHDSTHIATETVTTTSEIAVPATCLEMGQTRYTATFENELFPVQTKTDTDIDAIGHQWGEPAYVWNETETGYSVTATSICEHDETHITTETVTATYVINHAAVCEADGDMTYTASFESDLFTTQTKDVVIPMLGHKWGTPTYAWVETDAGYTVTGTTICEHDATHIGTQTVEATYEIVTPETTRADGLGRYTAPFTDERLSVQTKYVVRPMLRPTFYGEDTESPYVTVYEDGRTLYRYDIHIRYLDPGYRAVGMQLFVDYDADALTFAEARTTLAGQTGINDKDGRLLYSWASERDGVQLPDGTVVLSLYFTLNKPIAEGTVLPFRFTTAGNGIENGIAYLDDDDVVTEAEITYTEDGSILFRMPDAPTFAGEDAIASNAWKWKDGEVLYRYDIRIRDLTGEGLLINGAQVFVEYDGTLLALREAESAWNWTVYEKNGKTLAGWASDTDVLLHNDDVILSLWFARIKPVALGTRAEIRFTVNEHSSVSGVTVVYGGWTGDLHANTVDGSITFDAPLYGDVNCDGKITTADASLLLRAVVGLETLRSCQALNADTNCDGALTAEDAVLILRYVVGLIDAFPADAQ